jgi:fructose-bisphosphate aldolase, class II
MTRIRTVALLTEAAGLGRAVGAFNVLHLETAEAIVAGAETAGLPVILQLSQNCVAYHGAFRPIAGAMLEVAAASAVPVAVHLDHAEDEELVGMALAAGFDSVMFDGSTLPDAENVAATRRVVAGAHALGIGVEAELGEIGGKDGAHAPGVRTDPDDARAFTEATGVDALAVAVGSSHAMLERTADLDLDLVARLHDAVPVPLVLHGSSGVADDRIAAGIARGLVKINVSTHLNAVFTARLRAALAADPSVVDSRKYMAAARTAMSLEAARLLRLFAGEETERDEPQ